LGGFGFRCQFRTDGLDDGRGVEAGGDGGDLIAVQV